MEWSGKRTIIGCAIGCAVLIVVAIALAVGFGLWLNAPGAVLEPEQLLGSDTVGYAELRLSLDDPETAAFVERVIEGLQSISPEDVAALPAPIGGWIRSNREAKTRKDIEKLFPAVAAWTLRQGDAAGTDELQLLSVSMERASHQLMMADFFLSMALGRDEKTSKHRYLDETIYQLEIDRETTVTTFIDDGIVFLTSDLETAKQAVDRMQQALDTTATATPVDRLFDGVPRDRPLRGAITNAGGEARRLWSRLAADNGAAIDQSMWDGLTGLALSGELDPDGSFVGFVDVALTEAAETDVGREAWHQAFRSALPEGDYVIEIEPQTLDERIRLELRVPRLLELMVPAEFRRTGDGAGQDALPDGG